MATAALQFLVARTFRNRLGRQFGRLREPRYALALAIGAAYFWFALGSGHRRTPGPGEGVNGITDLMLALGLVLVAGWTWISAGSGRALAFSPAEVALLFPAPISRRALLHLKLARGQIPIMLNAVVWVALLGVGGSGLNLLARGVGIWCLLSVIFLHCLGAALVWASVKQTGRAGLRRHRLSLALLAVAAVGVGLALARLLPPLVHARSFADLGDALRRGSAEPVAAIGLWAFRAVVRPATELPPALWLRSLPAAGAVLLLHYAWVLQTDAAFEEAAADASLRGARERADRHRAGRSGRGSALWRLSPAGRPESALVWKNLTMLLRRRSASLWLAAAAGAVAAAWITGVRSPATGRTLGVIGLAWAGMLFVSGAQMIRNDLRADLLQLALIRSYPLSGRAVVRAEALGAALVAGAVQAGLGTAGLAALMGAGYTGTLPVLPQLALAAAVLLIPVNLLGFTMVNGAALVWPAWVRVGPLRGGGVEAMGQSVLVIGGYVAALAAALVVPALAGGGLYIAARPLLASWALVPAAGVAAAIVLAEASLLGRLLGRVYDTTDPDSVPAPL